MVVRKVSCHDRADTFGSVPNWALHPRVSGIIRPACLTTP
jgi:hypothetical protein